MLIRLAGELQVRPEYFLRPTYESDRPTLARQEPRALRDSLNPIVDNGVRSKADLLATEFTLSAADVEQLSAFRRTGSTGMRPKS